MEAIKSIIDSAGYSSATAMDLSESIEISVDGFMDLDITKVGDHHLSVAHHYKQRGDTMRDPEVVFSISDDGEWKPFEFWQDPTFHQYDSDGIDMDDFLEQWDKNIRQQGFVDAAEEQFA